MARGLYIPLYVMRSPVDNIIVTLDSAFETQYITPGGLKLYRQSHFNPEWNVTTVGMVVAVPERLTNNFEKKDYNIEVSVGDEIIMSYMVVFDMEIREYDTPIHRNMFYLDGKYYWKVDYINYMGKIIDGEVHAAQGYVFCEEIEEEREEKIGMLWMPEMVKKERPKGKARVVSVGKPKKGEPKLSVEKGDEVYFEENLAMRYTILNKEIKILHQSKILVKNVTKSN